ncbi:MAG: hypothetical protein O6844_07530 [Gammaproteobacteria bacterium]|nr:hypothetical protein [Gammaproteobacteria bacterium]MCZ6827720.1 hypothetical protein [Gammaproteobacteria bacterium]
MNKRNLGTQIIKSLLLVCMIWSVSPANGQQTTEQYIPIGYSPGVSDKYSYIGRIVAIDRKARTISVESRGVVRIIKVTAETRIWLDRSKARRENLLADYVDCEVGLKVELMHVRDNEDVADWIKIESK